MKRGIATRYVAFRWYTVLIYSIKGAVMEVGHDQDKRKRELFNRQIGLVEFRIMELLREKEREKQGDKVKVTRPLESL